MSATKQHETAASPTADVLDQCTSTRDRTGGAGGKRTAKHTKNRFAEFQRAEAKGYYGALDDGSDLEEDGDIATDMAVDSLAPTPTNGAADRLINVAATSEATTATDAPADVLRQQTTSARKAIDTKRLGPVAGTLNVKQQSMGSMAAKADKLVLSVTATKATRRMRIDANRTGLGALRMLAEEKAGMVQTSMARYMNAHSETHDADKDERRNQQATHTTANANLVTSDELVPATPESQEEFTMGITCKGTAEGDADLPTQVGQWLCSFNGYEVNVEANGPCAFLALYASTKNHPNLTLPNSPQTVKHATKMKSTIYACMMANLSHDVALGLVDPIAECTRIYPSQPPHSSEEAATAGLFAHYAMARERPVGKWQPVEYRAGTHELRAMAQFLREPLLVLDASASSDAHIQRYLYKDYRLADDTDHESGYVEVLSDPEAAEYLRVCHTLHLLPTSLVLRRQESHFHGVGHGTLWAKWQAEGDPAYAACLPDSYEWKTDINRLTSAEAEANMSTLNMLEDSER